jgi:hypothetical protein
MEEKQVDQDSKHCSAIDHACSRLHHRNLHLDNQEFERPSMILITVMISYSLPNDKKIEYEHLWHDFNARVTLLRSWAQGIGGCECMGIILRILIQTSSLLTWLGFYHAIFFGCLLKVAPSSHFHHMNFPLLISLVIYRLGCSHTESGLQSSSSRLASSVAYISYTIPLLQKRLFDTFIFSSKLLQHYCRHHFQAHCMRKLLSFGCAPKAGILIRIRSIAVPRHNDSFSTAYAA